MIRSRLVPVLAAVALLAAGATPAAAAPFDGASPPIRALPIAAGAEVGPDDGSGRLVVTTNRPAPGSSVANVTATTVDLASGTTTPLALPEPSCTPSAAGSRSVAVTCQTGPDARTNRFFTAPWNTGAWTPLPVPWLAGVDNLEQVRVTGIGTEWAAFFVQGYHWQHTTYQSLRGPESRNETGTATPATARVRPSLDRPDLMRPLCAPLVRSQQYGFETMDAFAPMPYVKPWGVVTLFKADSGDDYGPPVAGYALAHCGTKKRITFCRTSCSAPALSRHWLVWSDGTNGHVRDLRSGRTRTVKVPGQRVALRLVGDHVLATVQTKDYRATGYGVVSLPAR